MLVNSVEHGTAQLEKQFMAACNIPQMVDIQNINEPNSFLCVDKLLWVIGNRDIGLTLNALPWGPAGIRPGNDLKEVSIGVFKGCNLRHINRGSMHAG